jgi:hypothetical protein
MSSKKIILAGCSYTINTWSDGEPLSPPYTFGGFLQHKYNLNVDHIAVSGNSNEASIKQIYNYIKDNDVKDSTIIFQVTHLHRIGGEFNFLNKWINLQPQILDDETFTLDDINTHEIKDSEIVATDYMNLPDVDEWPELDSYTRNKIIEYYKLWLQLRYDDFHQFKDLLFKIDLLKAYLSQFNNKLLLIYWPDVNSTYKDSLKEYNFLKIDGEYSMLRWSKKNNVIGKDTHLIKVGHELLSDDLYKHIISNT